VRFYVCTWSRHLQQTCSNAVPTTCQQDVFALSVASLWKSCQRLVDNLLQGYWAQQTCHKSLQQLVIVPQFNNLSTGCVRTVCCQLVEKLPTTCWQLATRLLSSTDLSQVAPTTCYRPAFQQFVNELWVTTL
jgi:hypothetical protein